MGAAPSSITYATCGDWPCTPVARAVDGDVRFASLGPPSAYHECAVTAEGAIYCWGSVTAQGLPRADSTQSVQTTPVRLREPRF
jgi:hypothetical protein